MHAFSEAGARGIAIRAEHATIVWLRFEPHTAIGAVVEDLTCIGRHHFGFGAAAVRASNCGLQNHF
jgi:hypothetical protein